MKILVTGATGFIGTHVIHQLLEDGAEVIASSTDVARAEQAPWYGRIMHIPYVMEPGAPEVNLADYFKRPDAVIHLAWQGLPSYKSMHHVEINVLSNYFFLKNLVANGVNNVTVTGTCLEYGMLSGRLSEEMPARPVTPYGTGKLCLQLFLEALRSVHPYNLKWLRLFYVYGPGQNPNALIPSLERAIRNGEQTFRMSGGEQVRDFIPIQEIARSISKAARQNQISGIINCCSGKPIKVLDFIRSYLAQKKTDIQLEPGYYPYPEYEPMEFWGDNSKLLKIIC